MESGRSDEFYQSNATAKAYSIPSNGLGKSGAIILRAPRLQRRGLAMKFNGQRTLRAVENCILKFPDNGNLYSRSTLPGRSP